MKDRFADCRDRWTPAIGLVVAAVAVVQDFVVMKLEAAEAVEPSAALPAEAAVWVFEIGPIVEIEAEEMRPKLWQ